MIDKDKLRQTIETALVDTPMFLTGLNISADNGIVVEIDSDKAMDVDACANITSVIEAAFDRDEEDYSLEVGSAGLTSPLKMRRQYMKYVGKDLEVLTCDGRKLRGVLTAVRPSDAQTPVYFTIETPVKVKQEGAKRPVSVMQATELCSDDCKSVRYDLKI